VDAIDPRIFEISLGYFLRPVREHLADESVREIMINGHDEIFVERRGEIVRTDSAFRDPEQLMAAVRNIAQYVGRFVREEEPRFDARLPGGHRVHVVLPPISRGGVSVTIRKHSKSTLDLEEIIRLGSISREGADFLARCMRAGKNVIVSGGTGTGKTTLLNCLSALIPKGQRVLTIEDTAELQIQQDHVIALEARPADRKGRGAVTIRDLLHSALRMRPDRIIVGECRGGEAFDLLQAMNTGHGGSMSTLHANSPLESLRRLESLALFAGEDVPLRFIRAQVASAINVIVQLQRHAGGRIVQSIAESLPLDERGEYGVVELFTYDFEGRALIATGQVASFLDPRGG
jgi:pilus assembly protein CpaF